MNIDILWAFDETRSKIERWFSIALPPEYFPDRRASFRTSGDAVKILENQVLTASSELAVAWSAEGMGQLVVYLRRQGVPIHQASASRDGILSLVFEPHLAQAEILEGLLLAWPGIVAVERAGARVMYAYGPGLREFHHEGRTRWPTSLVRRWFR